MPTKFRYLNTDLDLASATDLTPLVGALEQRGLYALTMQPGDDGIWYGTWEVQAGATSDQEMSPEQTIVALLAAVESLDESERRLWTQCTVRRDLNIGFDCGHEPWAFNFALSPDVLRRIADLGARVVVTFYPVRDEEDDANAAR